MCFCAMNCRLGKTQNEARRKVYEKAIIATRTDSSTIFFYNNIFYKNIEAEIGKILRIF